MKFIDRILEDIPQIGIEEWGIDNELKYVVNTRELLKELKEFEIEIPNEFYDKYKNEWGNGVLEYMQQVLGANEDNSKGENTYNYGGRVSHDIHYITYFDKYNNEFYIALNIHRSGDVRTNYTEFCLLKFDGEYAFYELVDEICFNLTYFYISVDGKEYRVSTNMFTEYMFVDNYDTDETYEICCYDNESCINEIKKIVGKVGK